MQTNLDTRTKNRGVQRTPRFFLTFYLNYAVIFSNHFKVSILLAQADNPYMELQFPSVISGTEVSLKL